MSEPGPIDSAKQFKDTPVGQQQRWTVEIAAAKENQKKWWEEGDRVNREYLGERTAEAPNRLNLFYADVSTKNANLSGLPKVRVRRRHADPSDDVARVSAQMLERLLNTDIERDSDGYRRALKMARGDWQRPGLGQLRFRYVVETEKVPGQEAQTDDAGNEIAPAVPETERKTFEDVETVYTHWKDYLWSPCRFWEEHTWEAFKAEMTRDELEKRFGAEKSKIVPMQKREPAGSDSVSSEIKDAWNRAEVWEIWDKTNKRRVMFCEGMNEILESVDDPFGLPGFFPAPEPIVAVVTTDKFIPRPYYMMAEDLYREAHDLTRRIRGIVKAIKAVGGYDKSAAPELSRILNEACENELIPCEQWNLIKERGGLDGVMGLMPIEGLVQALVQLVEQRNLVKMEIHEVTGQSDIMRGQQAMRETATTSRIKARFGSARITTDQDDFAEFASRAQRIRAALICKFFDEETIIKRSNMALTETVEVPQPPAPPPMPGAPPPPPPGPPKKEPNWPLLKEAVALLKDDFAAYRVDVDGESLAMTDYDAVQQEGIAIMQATADFFQRLGPMMAGSPQVAEFGLKLYQAVISGFRGAERYESIIDQAIDQAKQAAAAPKPPPPPDPKLEATKVKAQADIQGTQMDMQAKTAEHGMKMQQIQAEMAQDKARTQNEIARAQLAPKPMMPMEEEAGHA